MWMYKWVEVALLLHATYQVIEDIPLVDVDGDEGLKLHALHLLQVLSGHSNEGVQHLKEVCIGLGHDLLITASTPQGHLWVTCPDHLDAQKTHLVQAYAGNEWQSAQNNT